MQEIIQGLQTHTLETMAIMLNRKEKLVVWMQFNY